MRHSANLCPSYHPVFRHCSGIVVLKSKTHPPVVSIDIPRHLRLVTALFFGFLLDNREWVRWCNCFHPLVLSLQGVYQEFITIIRFALWHTYRHHHYHHNPQEPPHHYHDNHNTLIIITILNWSWWEILRRCYLWLWDNPLKQRQWWWWTNYCDVFCYARIVMGDSLMDIVIAMLFVMGVFKWK